MSIIAAEIEHRLTGGTANTNPDASLGGAPSTAGGGAINTAVKNNLFDDVSPAELTAGKVEYRCVAVKNTNGALTLADARAYVQAQPAISEVDLAVAAEAVNANPATIANESTAPTGVVFSRPASYAAGLQLNGATGLAAGAFKGLWIRRTVNPGASPGSASFTYAVEGTTT